MEEKLDNFIKQWDEFPIQDTARTLLRKRFSIYIGEKVKPRDFDTLMYRRGWVPKRGYVKSGGGYHTYRYRHIRTHPDA